jgi:hypothetical protein
MTLKVRRFLYIFTIILFCVGAPIVLLFGLGKDFDYSSRSFVETGGIYIKAYPKNIDISINGDYLGAKRPTRIRYLTPGTYAVKLSKPGWYSITASVDVIAEKTTLLDPIELFAEYPTRVSTLQNVDRVFTSPFNSSAIIVTKQNDSLFTVYERNGESLKNIGTTKSPVTNIQWTSAESDILFSTNNGFYIFNKADNSFIGPLEQINNLTLTLNQTGIAYGSSNGTIIEVNYKNRTTKNLSVKGTMYNPVGNYIIRGEKNGDQTAIFVAQTDLGSFRKIITTGTVASLQPLQNNLALVRTTNESFLINLAANQVIRLGTQLSSWSIINNNLFYCADFEIWQIDLQTFNKVLIDRTSADVSSIGASPKHSALMLATPHELAIHYLHISNPTIIRIPNSDDIIDQKTIAISDATYAVFILHKDTSLEIRDVDL